MFQYGRMTFNIINSKLREQFTINRIHFTGICLLKFENKSRLHNLSLITALNLYQELFSHLSYTGYIVPTLFSERDRTNTKRTEWGS